MDIVARINEILFALALTLPRIGTAFIILPLFTQETVPALIRNAIYIGLALIVLPLTVKANEVVHLSWIDWPFILIKEMFIGVSLGFVFSTIFWAATTAGAIIDTQVGSNMAQQMDPVQGHQSSPNGRWLSLFITWLFMASGGFMVFLDLLLGSYRIWPVTIFLPNLPLTDLSMFIGQFSYLMSAALLMAAPVILILSLIDIAFGLVNRFAQQINLLSITMPIKSWVAVFILILNLALIVEVISRKLAENSALKDIIKQWFVSG